jgi:flagellar protein FliO/FliZ
MMKSTGSILLASSFESFLQLLWVLLMLVLVLVVIYVTMRWMGNYQKTHSRNQYLTIIETIPAGSNSKMISIVQAGRKYLVVSIGKDEIHLLAELTEEEMVKLPKADGEGSSTQENFQDILNKLKNNFPKKQG